MDLAERNPTAIARHPWEVSRCHFFVSLLKQLGVTDTRRWLDVGAGDAWLAQQLKAVLRPEATITCWDPNYAEGDLVSGVLADGDELVLTVTRPAGLFDGVMMLDVVEHVEDDRRFVGEIVRDTLAPDGWVLVSVPAYQILFSEHDRMLKHFRRYSPRQCRELLADAGLEVRAEGGLFHSLLALRAVQVSKERLVGLSSTPEGIGAWNGGPRITRLTTSVLEAETRLSLRLGSRSRVLPGLSYWAFCRRPDSNGVNR